ncbi:murein transglycosylase A [Amphiplicatus metriothermophilus]|uniref:peptidoglycan lytic exotransglycosylase n=1 Tax=Amphiplicatus metriothermophilus TaxID=1519374 RepID=A0A239PKE9_9PROT|nr:MltA domain-containing protein [Amphiplicatus metriothermophilus]MBB5517611.1 membrane-bound lytic murein transglycosylase A [Amphiplicatus metriothermophilus]SNT68055.1 membrane-bound lytic murein transglycosylase A [Amphiplicatus metriothermophilus]
MLKLDSRLIALALSAAVAAALIAAALTFSDVFRKAGPPGADAYGPPQFSFRVASFAELPGWSEDDPAEAIPALRRSCARILTLAPDAPANPAEALGAAAGVSSVAGSAAAWRRVCLAALALPDGSQAAARLFFEEQFRPLKIVAIRPPTPGGPAADQPPLIEERGLFTGYYEPVIEASPRRTPDFSAPVLARPDDLVMVDLGRFRPELAGERIAGYVQGGALHPYPDHRAINEGVLEGRAEPLAWLRPDDLFFMQIQGSGRLRFEDGREIRVGYDGQNGHPYFAIGRALIERGVVSREAMSMQAIRDWLARAAPEDARALRELNPSYVFFRMLPIEDPALGPPGAEGVSLTPGRSLAVDRRYHPFGAPVWVALDGEGDPSGFSRLMIAQDAGGAIKGPIRGDVFFGAGEEAGATAGAFRVEGEMYVLVPAPVAAQLSGAPDPHTRWREARRRDAE